MYSGHLGFHIVLQCTNVLLVLYIYHYLMYLLQIRFSYTHDNQNLDLERSSYTFAVVLGQYYGQHLLVHEYYYN